MEVFNKVIVVTGAGSGIGRALTLQLVNDGARVAAVDSDEEQLSQTVQLSDELGGQISQHTIDISDRTAVEALPARLMKTYNDVDALITHADASHTRTSLNDLQYEDIERVLNTNLYSVIHMMKAFLPHLLKRPVAHVVNISSMYAFFSVTGRTIYGASKAATRQLTEGLYADLLETNVHVTSVILGRIAPDVMLSDNTGHSGSSQKNQTRSLANTSAGRAARTIIRAMEHKKFQVYVGSDARLMGMLYRISPSMATRFMYNQTGP